MPVFMEWSDKYLLGVKEFDEHHEHLVELMNKSYDLFKNQAPQARLEMILDELFEYTAYHFAAEEKWMAEHSYPKLAEHKEEHALFRQKIIEFQHAFHDGQPTIKVDLYAYLAKWLIAHIQEKDPDYGSFNAGKGDKQ
ncbi:hemerythrin family protein [Geobacter pelophilus]|uniref:Hemerythrin family protein n=1 Tax=Geoanaerobacter pelophilus TaxID=60036 RepID=A0AAW4LFD8_9BACT|nr:bacteriohemerythrin [Geoanaerobacter pelophilus]MBT0665891.1 hemerythrin family protein [Geoanaerobacter pelophilus]